MITEFNRLNSSEIELMLKAPISACILIAGADNHIDRKEIEASIEQAKKKHKKFKDSPLSKFYLIMSEDFEDKLKVVLQSYPSDVNKRNEMISKELEKLNEILPKLDRKFAQEFYNSIKEIALQTAESSGGLLGIKSIGEEEARLIDLPMLKNPSNY